MTLRHSQERDSERSRDASAESVTDLGLEAGVLPLVYALPLHTHEGRASASVTVDLPVPL